MKVCHTFLNIPAFKHLFSKPKMLRIMKITLFLTSCWLAMASFFHPADKTILNGTVTDETGKSIARATVNVLQNKSLVKSGTTDVEGKFIFELAPGTYEVEASRTGFVGIRYAEVLVKESAISSVLFRLTASTSSLEEVIVVTYGGSFAKDDLFMRSYSTDEGVATAPLGASHTKRKSMPASKAAPAPATMGGESGIARGERKMPTAAPKSEESTMPPALGMEMPPEPAEYTLIESSAADFDKKMDKTIPGGPTSSTSIPRAGLLTAGEWNDLHNWNRHWIDLLTDGEISTYQNTYRCFPSQRYTVLLTNAENFPVADAYVKLTTSSGDMLWESHTDNTGKAELWAGFFEQKEYANLRAEAWINGKKEDLGLLKPAKDGINLHQIQVECHAPQKVDIVWAVDATGSMGDEIEYLKTELLDVIGRAKKHNPELDFRMGTVFYRDKGDEYITKSSGLSTDISQTVEFIRKQFAGGGGDYPEAVHSALEEAVFNQKWSEQAIARICFLVLDASPHADQPEVIASIQRSIREAARLGIRIVPVTASGIQKDTEFLMKFFGLATNGTYTFLTDHSGIGSKHLEPTTDEYKVELLNDLLVRIITEYTTIKTCEGKSSIRFEEDPQQQQQSTPDQALYYPNPASTQFTLELPVAVESVTIYDSEGKAVRKIEQAQSGRHTIIVSDMQEGFYTIRILRENRMQSGKLMVIR